MWIKRGREREREINKRRFVLHFGMLMHGANAYTCVASLSFFMSVLHGISIAHYIFYEQTVIKKSYDSILSKHYIVSSEILV